MTIKIASPIHLPRPVVSARVAESILSGRTISDDIAASIASWFGDRHPVMARLSSGQRVTYADFQRTMLDIATGLDMGFGGVDEGEAICLDFLDEWATLTASESEAA